MLGFSRFALFTRFGQSLLALRLLGLVSCSGSLHRDAVDAAEVAGKQIVLGDVHAIESSFEP